MLTDRGQRKLAVRLLFEDTHTCEQTHHAPERVRVGLGRLCQFLMGPRPVPQQVGDSQACCQVQSARKVVADSNLIENYRRRQCGLRDFFIRHGESPLIVE